MNKVMLKGRLTADPELKKVGDEGIRVAEFSIAVDRRFDRDKTDFINCQAWRKTAELIEKHFTKGKEILVVGELHIDKYTNKDDEVRYATRVVVDEFDFCGSKGDSSAKDADDDEDEEPKKKPTKKTKVDVEYDDDDDLPF